MLGGFGYVATQAMHRGGLPTPWAKADDSPDAGGTMGSRGATAPYSNESQVDRSHVVSGETKRNLATPGEMARDFNRS